MDFRGPEKKVEKIFNLPFYGKKNLFSTKKRGKKEESGEETKSVEKKREQSFLKKGFESTT